MDTLTYLAFKASGLPKHRVFGMGGALDSSRFKCYLAKATGANINDIDGMVIGVPAVIGRKGIEKIVELDLTKEEAEKFAASAAAVRKTNQVLHEINAIP